MKQLLPLAVIAGTAAIALAGLAGASPAPTTRVSVDSNGVEGDQNSFGPAMSFDGRFIAFLSQATNLVPGDTNSLLDIFVHDRDTGQTTRVSVSSVGIQGNNDSYDPKLTTDGRFVAFVSAASNLVPQDFNGTGDIFVHDRETGLTTRVSVNSVGVEGNGESSDPTITADGRYIAFTSFASNLVPGDSNGREDVFVHDRETGQITRVSVSSAGAEGKGTSHEAEINDEGTFVAFSSTARNLVPGDTNGKSDVFVHDPQTGETTRVSVTSAGAQGNGPSDRPVLSSDGAIVAFDSEARNLVTGDRNRVPDVFVHDRLTGETTRISVKSAGGEGTKKSFNPDISGDGRLISFNSNARLDSIDTNGKGDVYVHDRQSAQTTIESVSSAGTPGNDQSIRSSLTTDGLELSFSSLATNLVPGDGNLVRDIFVHELATSS